MENKSNSRKGNIFQLILCIAVVGLIVTVIIQNRNIDALTKTKNDISLVENTSPEVKTDITNTVEKFQITINKKDQDKVITPIEKNAPEKKLADEKTDDITQSEQVGEFFEKLTSEMQMNPAMESLIRGQAEKRIRSIYDSFAKEYNLSPEARNELVDLLVEKQMETVDITSLLGEVQKGNITREDLKQQEEYVNNIYNEKISGLLSPEQFEAYREYAKYEEERLFLSEFKNNMEYTGGINLDIQQENDLVVAMHNEKQRLDENQKEFQASTNPQDKVFSSENRKKRVELQKDLLNGYLESSIGILSNSQHARLSEYIDSQKSILDMGAALLGNINQEKKDMYRF